MSARNDTPSVASAALDPLTAPFPTPFRSEQDRFGSGSQPRPLVELAMCRLSAAIRSKPSWRTKRHDAHITDKWRKEAADIDPLLTPAAIQYVLDELDYYDSLLDRQSGIEMSTVDGVWQSDSLLPDELITQVKRTVQQCWGHESKEQRDWHPGSGQQVWDIVHPSLYCLVAGRTRVVSADVPVDGSLGAMCGGRVLGAVQYGRLVAQQTAAIQVTDKRWERAYRVPDSDEEAKEAEQRRQTEQAGEKRAMLSEAEEAALARAAWQDGKIVLWVWVPMVGRSGSSHKVAVYVKPDAREADVMAQAAPYLPASWTQWSLMRGEKEKAATEEEQTLPLYAMAIRSGDELTAAQDEQVQDKAAVVQAAREWKAKLAITPIRILVQTQQNIPISVHRLDESATVDTLVQQLCDGAGEVKQSCYPSFARGVPPLEQRLYVNSDSRQPNFKRLHPHRTFAHYQLHNGDKVTLTWHRVTEAELSAETSTIQLRVQPLRSDRLPAVLLDVCVDDAVWHMKDRLCALLPGHTRWKKLQPSHCHLYFPATSETELSDDSVTLSALGLSRANKQQVGEAIIGVRWEGDREQEAAFMESGEKDEMNYEPVADDSEQKGDEKSQQGYQLTDADSKAAGGEEKAVADELMLTIKMTTDDESPPELRLTVKPSTTVREVKERIMSGQVDDSSKSRAREMGRGVPVARQQLTCYSHDKAMNDTRTLAFYGFTSATVSNEVNFRKVAAAETTAPTGRRQGSKRQKMLRSSGSGDAPAARTIELSMLQLHGGTTAFGGEEMREAIDCPADQTIGELKLRLFELYMDYDNNTDKARMMRALGEPALSDDLTVTEAGLADGDSVVMDQYTTTIGVTLVLPSGALSTFTLMADGRTTVRELKQRIAARADGYAVEWQWAELVVANGSSSSGRRRRLAHEDSWAAVSINDEQPLSHYGVGSADSDTDQHAHMLVCRRPLPRNAQHNEQEAAEQSHQLLRLHVRSAETNDIYEVRVMAWQSLVAVKWQLAWMKADQFDAMRLSLCPPTASSSTVNQHAAATQLLPLTDDLASLQSAGVMDVRVLQLNSSEVVLTVKLPEGVEPYKRPMQNADSKNCLLHVQLDDTVAQLRDKLHTLVDMPADRMLFRFHRLLPVELDDRLTLRQLGFTARGRMEKYISDAWVGRYVAGNELTVRLLPHPATQPPSVEQQRANKLVQVGVRLLPHSGRVYRVWLQSDETVGEVRAGLFSLLESALMTVDAERNWVDESIALTVGGRTGDESSKVSRILRECAGELPVIDVLIVDEQQEAADGEDEDENEDEVEVEEGGEEETGEDGGEDEKDEEDEKDDGDDMSEDGDGHSPHEDDMEDESAHSDTAQPAARTAKEEKAESTVSAAADTADIEDGQHFCLHPQHPLQLMQPYLAVHPTSLWRCDVCRGGEQLTPDRRCWHCEPCKYDVCQQCFNRASTTYQEGEGEAEDGSSGRSTDEQQPTEDGDVAAEEAEETGAGKRKARKEYHTSAKYAWLPTDFHIDHDGSAHCLSYINNLHPMQHAAMYPLIERVVAHFIPLFERVLTSLRHPPRDKVPVCQWYYAADDAQHEKELAAKQRRLGADFDDEEEFQQWNQSKPCYQPDVPPFDPPTLPPAVVSLRGRRLQLIVKLADIVLTPQQPHYAGGVWHVEGMRNECIVASGIAYYGQSNISPSSLAFRCAVAEPQYEQNDSRGVEAVYGLRNEEALVQPLGAVDTCSGRCIAFPNIYQHRVAPFSLLDRTQPGHRSILVVFLVDPAISIVSTSRVPPQQREWMAATPYSSAVTDVLGGVRVLSEVVDSYLDWPMSREEAEQHRERLMHERKYFVQKNTAEVFEREFSLCEH